MLTIITLPYFFEDEAERITAKFQSGLRRLHLRKPDSTETEMRALLDTIPQVYHPRIVLHDHFSLTNDYNIGGVHLNSRNDTMPIGWNGSVSISCHSIEELETRKKDGCHDSKGYHRHFDYLSLSPIFDSVSKKNYHAVFSDQALEMARTCGIIDKRVFALGGVTRKHLNTIKQMGFGGAMMLGDAWQDVTRKEDKTRLPITLTIAGSDTSAGAGIQQDMKTMTRLGCYAITVITAITSQNTMGVHGVMAVPAEVVENQLRAVFSDLRVEAIKIGMIPNYEVAHAIANVLEEELQLYPIPIVLDPIMKSTSGRRLMNEDCVSIIANRLFPLCTLVTPNLPEQQYMDDHGIKIQTNTLIKGGHAEGNEMTDYLFLHDENVTRHFTSPRIPSRNLHGTGCTLSSAITAQLAKGNDLTSAVQTAKHVLTNAIIGGATLNIGEGNGPLLMQ